MNPLDILDGVWGKAGDVASQAAEHGWSGIMLSLWSAGLWVLRLVLGVIDKFMTPDLTAEGPAAGVYRTTFWIAASLVVVMALVQLGIAAFRRDGKSLARVVIGVGQFVAVWAAWLAYGALLVTACGGLTRALMRNLLGINGWSQWEPMPAGGAQKAVAEGGLATVLGILGIFLFIAAIGHFFVMLTRAAALLVLAAVTPIAAAGLVSDAGRSWFWKSLRWFHAAALTPVLTVLVMGLGTKLTAGVAQGGADSAEAAVGTAFAGVMLILICIVAPAALFRLLAFADPGTSSGAAMRSGMSASGGIQGLLSGSGGKGGGSSSSAASTSQDGQSQGEAQRNQQTANRVASVASAAGPVGDGFAAGLGVVAGLGEKAATVGVDTMNQTGIGDSSYFPDHESGRGRGAQNDQQGARRDDDGCSGGGDPQDPSPPPTHPPPPGGADLDPGGSSPPAPSAGGQGGLGHGGQDTGTGGQPPGMGGGSGGSGGAPSGGQGAGGGASGTAGGAAGGAAAGGAVPVA